MYWKYKAWWLFLLSEANSIEGKCDAGKVILGRDKMWIECVALWKPPGGSSLDSSIF